MSAVYAAVQVSLREICDCDGNVVDECGVCGGSGIPEGACDCDGNVAADGYDCDGNCLADADGDGVCDEFELAGCTASNACNYDSNATDDDGSCDFCSCATSGMVMNDYTVSVEVYATDIVPGQTTYRLYQQLANTDDFMSSVLVTTRIHSVCRPRRASTTASLARRLPAV